MKCPNCNKELTIELTQVWGEKELINSQENEKAKHVAQQSKSNKRDMGSSPDTFSTFYEILGEYRRNVEVLYEKGVYSLTDRNLLHHCILNLKDKLKQENKSNLCNTHTPKSSIIIQNDITKGCGKDINQYSDYWFICGEENFGVILLCENCRNKIILTKNKDNVNKEKDTYQEHTQSDCFECGHRKSEHPVRNLAGRIICNDFKDRIQDLSAPKEKIQ